ncbi:LytTR family DNA-binding domain-containing protein [Marinilabilia salmonicolor]|jgi:DNA-binding LytR/AlgR family response regulator|uniref:LytTR family two component transcriptional regulator n=1 Tax=Marinilabilia salmonicolor TaxID=989 RepID=A0A2T0XMB5_9BACT|nr:LytTR family DNA-binding domain-containing protein [Marinilabilia salmonicolor]PRZ00066.1 LytTR family two component transcriptional regulator [Marinilabilia salmonicolor]RCW38693.1 LytTR family two component transcriptional regulator [Marinilabilia salmonicolor]
MNCIIIDDDKLSIKIIEEFVGRTEGLHLTGSYSSAVEAINSLNQPDAEKVDLIFLDIEMPEMSGIEFLESLDIIPQVVIYSSQEKYALESYEYDVTDYLLKPVQFGRFIKAVNRARERFDKKESPVKESTEIFIKNNGSLVRIKYDDILWIEALENYVVLNTFNDKYTIHFTMKSIADKMPADKFMRIHRSFIVNFSKIKVIEDNSVVIKTDSGTKVIPIGKSYRDKLMNDINLISK